MPKKPRSYLRPTSLDEALAALSLPDHVALGGGAHMLATEAGLDVEAVVDLQDTGLDTIDRDPATQSLQIGAVTRLVDLAEFLQTSDLPGELPTLLQQAIHQSGPNTYRNAATLGGLVASRLPDSELLAALLVAEAKIALRLPQVETIDLATYMNTATRPAGLITTVTVTLHPGRSAAARVARTPADYPIVSVTAWLPDGETVRLAATGIAERPLRLREAESACANELNDKAIETAASLAGNAATHPGDFRGDAVYRARMATVLTRRVLRELTVS